MAKIAASGSISQRHGSADPNPDPRQKVMVPEHWKKEKKGLVACCHFLYLFFHYSSRHTVFINTTRLVPEAVTKI